MDSRKLPWALLLTVLLALGGCGKQEGAPQAVSANEPSQAASTEAKPIEVSERAKAEPAAKPEQSYLRDVYSPLHFQPAIASAKDEECLACHKEILEDQVLEKSPAGLMTVSTKAWYQQLETYAGDQATFHQRHITTPYAKKVMNLKCNTCHQGHDPRDEAPGTSATATPVSTHDFTLRKQVNPETICLRCHGQMPWQYMTGLTGPWPTQKETWSNNCLACHVVFRVNRHRVNYLNPEAIEEEAAKSGDSCYGCHGGRAWYRISFPYPRHKFEGMADEIPEWAKDRPTESEARFLVGVTPASTPAPAAVEEATTSQ